MKVEHNITKIVFIFCFVFFGLQSNAVTRISLASGTWTDAAIWSPSGAPACGDSIVIMSGHTVSNTTQQDYTGCGQPMAITIFGTLLFSTGFKLKLPCGSKISVALGGSIQAGGGGGASNYIQICGATVWDAGDGEYLGPACLPPTPCNAVVLPVELISFNAQVKNNSIKINWSTQTEKNNAQFDLEKSADANNFTTLVSTKSKANTGNSNVKLDYELTDEEPLSPTTYYRLKQIDNDKTFTYSRIVSVSFIKEKSIKFTIYPNPNNGEFTADISGLENNHNVVILLADAQGKLVYKSNFFINDEGSARLQIVPDTKIQSGVYFCTLVLEEIEYKVKVIVS